MDNERDGLTGLLTPASFLERLEHRARHGEALILAALDLDRFLSFNEQYGHQAGDEWLRACAHRLEQAFGPGSLAARYGGDEMMALLPGGNLDEAYQQAEALRQGYESDPPTIQHGGQQVRPAYTISIGLAAYPANAGDARDLLEKSQTALRRAKLAGGNQVCLFQETDTLTGLLNGVASQRALQAALAQARRQDEPVGVFLLDIDAFQKINEEHGRRAGDEILRRLARILQANFGETGSVGRIAGDELIVILPGQRADSTFILAEEVRRRVEDSPVAVMLAGEEDQLRFTISGGVAAFPQDAADQVDLMRKAGEALYRSKQAGRNRLSLPAAAQMITKTSYYTQVQLERLAALARKQDKTEAFLLREALDDLLRRYGEIGD